MSQTIELENICRESFAESNGQTKHPDLKHLGLVKGGCLMDERQMNDPKIRDLLLKTALTLHLRAQFPDTTHVYDFNDVPSVDEDGANFHVYGDAYGPGKP